MPLGLSGPWPGTVHPIPGAASLPSYANIRTYLIPPISDSLPMSSMTIHEVSEGQPGGHLSSCGLQSTTCGGQRPVPGFTQCRECPSGTQAELTWRGTVTSPSSICKPRGIRDPLTGSLSCKLEARCCGDPNEDCKRQMFLYEMTGAWVLATSLAMSL